MLFLLSNERCLNISNGDEDKFRFIKYKNLHWSMFRIEITDPPKMNDLQEKELVREKVFTCFKSAIGKINVFNPEVGNSKIWFNVFSVYCKRIQLVKVEESQLF